MWKKICIKFLLIWLRVSSAEEAKITTITPEIDVAVNNKFGTNLVTQLRNDVNLDLPEDEEYEDLRAELLAYHTVLAKLSDDSNSARRSLMTTPCWQLGGICVNYKLCIGFRSLSEVRGCKDHHNVCCFTWNKYRVKDMRDHGIPGPFPWSIQLPYGGPDVDKATEPSEEGTETARKKKKRKPKNRGDVTQSEDADEVIGKLSRFPSNMDKLMPKEDDLRSPEELQKEKRNRHWEHVND